MIFGTVLIPRSFLIPEEDSKVAGLESVTEGASENVDDADQPVDQLVKFETVMHDGTHPPRFASLDELATFIEAERLKVLAYIDRNLGPALRRKLEPEDILQEVTLTAMASPAQFDVPGRDAFKLLCQLAEQRIIDAHRHHVSAQKRSAAREVSAGAAGGDTDAFGFINLLVASITSPSQAFSRNQKEFHLQQAVASLSEEQRKAIHLRYLEGWPTKEIAEHLGKTDGAVRVLLTRTLARLQELM
jgi:RNA polymerase sigma-70 factor (subfamily 1)